MPRLHHNLRRRTVDILLEACPRHVGGVPQSGLWQCWDCGWILPATGTQVKSFSTDVVTWSAVFAKSGSTSRV